MSSMLAALAGPRPGPGPGGPPLPPHLAPGGPLSAPPPPDIASFWCPPLRPVTIASAFEACALSIAS